MEEENVSARGRVVHFRENKNDAKAKCGCINVNGLTFSLKWDNISCKRCLKLRPAMWDLLPNDRGWPTRDYVGTCSKCERQFSGHKRQIVCRCCEEETLKLELEVTKENLYNLEHIRDHALNDRENLRIANDEKFEIITKMVNEKDKTIDRLRRSLLAAGVTPELVQVIVDG